MHCPWSRDGTLRLCGNGLAAITNDQQSKRHPPGPVIVHLPISYRLRPRSASRLWASVATIGKQRTMRVVRLVDEADWKSLWPIVENIFLATSRVQKFAHEQARNSFKVRWLDRYLNHYIDSFFIARSDEGGLIGYLAGCLENPINSFIFSMTRGCRLGGNFKRGSQ